MEKACANDASAPKRNAPCGAFSLKALDPGSAHVHVLHGMSASLKTLDPGFRADARLRDDAMAKAFAKNANAPK